MIEESVPGLTPTSPVIALEPVQVRLCEASAPKLPASPTGNVAAFAPKLAQPTKIASANALGRARATFSQGDNMRKVSDVMVFLQLNCGNCC